VSVARIHARLARMVAEAVATVSGEFVAGEVLRSWSLAKAWVPGPPIGARIGHAAPGPHAPGRSDWVPHPGDEHYDGNLWGATGKVTATDHRERRESPGGEHWVTIRGHAVWIDQSGLFHFHGKHNPGTKPGHATWKDWSGHGISRTDARSGEESPVPDDFTKPLHGSPGSMDVQERNGVIEAHLRTGWDAGGRNRMTGELTASIVKASELSPTPEGTPRYRWEIRTTDRGMPTDPHGAQDPPGATIERVSGTRAQALAKAHDVLVAGVRDDLERYSAHHDAITALPDPPVYRILSRPGVHRPSIDLRSAEAIRQQVLTCLQPGVRRTVEDAMAHARMELDTAGAAILAAHVERQDAVTEWGVVHASNKVWPASDPMGRTAKRACAERMTRASLQLQPATDAYHASVDLIKLALFAYDNHLKASRDAAHRVMLSRQATMAITPTVLDVPDTGDASMTDPSRPDVHAAAEASSFLNHLFAADRTLPIQGAHDDYPLDPLVMPEPSSEYPFFEYHPVALDHFRLLVTRKSGDVRPSYMPMLGVRVDGPPKSTQRFLQPQAPRVTVSDADDTPTQVFVHEFTHHIEQYCPDVRRKVMAFYDRRTQGFEPVPLRDLTGNQNFPWSELSKPDRFHDPYLGKVCGAGASEVLSVGTESLYTDPVGLALSDPDLFRMLMDVYRG
jgi:hypothetical protein